MLQKKLWLGYLAINLEVYLEVLTSNPQQNSGLWR